MTNADLNARTVAMLRRLALELGTLTLDLGALIHEIDTAPRCKRCGHVGGRCKAIAACSARVRSERAVVANRTRGAEGRSSAAVKSNITRRQKRAAIVAGGVQ